MKRVEYVVRHEVDFPRIRTEKFNKFSAAMAYKMARIAEGRKNVSMKRMEVEK